VLRCGFEFGVFFRALSDGMIGLAPALCCSEDEMDMIFSRISRTLDDLLDDSDVRSALR
jgi:adenosylmethionine-8-amino-7-oxononanoate aminotransferase